MMPKHSWHLVSMMSYRKRRFQSYFKCEKCGLITPATKSVDEEMEKLERRGGIVDCDEVFVRKLMDE